MRIGYNQDRVIKTEEKIDVRYIPLTERADNALSSTQGGVFLPLPVDNLNTEDSRKSLSAKQGKELKKAIDLGFTVGQSFKNEKPNRMTNVTYINEGVKPIFVTICVSYYASESPHFYIDGRIVGYFSIKGVAASLRASSLFTGIINPGSSYKIENGTVEYWEEYK